MNTEMIFRSLNEISDEYVLDAAPGIGVSSARSGKRAGSKGIRPKTAWLAAAAAVICIVAVGAVIRQHNIPENTAVVPGGTTPVDNTIAEDPLDTSLPKIALVYAPSEGQGFGVSIFPKGELPAGTMLHDEDVPEKLPVFRNNSFDAAGFPHGLSEKQMLELFKARAEKLGFGDLEPERIIADGEFGKADQQACLVELRAEKDNVRLSVFANGTEAIAADSRDKLPEDIGEILGFAEMVTSNHSEYSKTEEDRKYRHFATVYDMLDRQDKLSAAVMHVFEYGELSGQTNLTIFNGKLISEKIAEYPVISLQNALKMLDEGKFVQGSGVDVFPGRESIVASDISYELRPTLESFVPFYHFWVKLPAETAEKYGAAGMDAYGELYVPAIDVRYFETSPLTWN
ncbi:MAG: hypothetical protein IJM39_01390 [Firmicutes bacterium]|nr:hypothetical protein [Bacillota bacterium]